MCVYGEYKSYSFMPFSYLKKYACLCGKVTVVICFNLDTSDM